MIGQLEQVLAGRPRALGDLATAERSTATDVDLDGWHVLTRWWELDQPVEWLTHRHPEHELLWDVTGFLAVSIDDRVWMLPPGMGMWIPAGIDHAVAAASSTSFACTFVAAESCSVSWPEPKVVAIGPLTAEALRHYGTDGIDERMRARIVEVAFALLSPAEDVPPLPVPRDPRARRIAEGLLADPGAHRSLDEWARWAHVSTRTARRLFANETGMSMAQWRSHARLRRAVGLLGDGATVAAAARQVGYHTPSAFSAAFRRAFGEPPGRFMAHHSG